MKKLFVLVALLLVFALPAQAGTGSYLPTGGQVCAAAGKVRMRFVVSAQSTPVVGYYIYGAGHSTNSQSPTPNTTWTNVFVPLNANPGTVIFIHTNMKRWFSTWNGQTSRIAFSSGGLNPAPVVIKGSPFFSCV